MFEIGGTGYSAILCLFLSMKRDGRSGRDERDERETAGIIPQDLFCRDFCAARQDMGKDGFRMSSLAGNGKLSALHWKTHKRAWQITDGAIF